MSTAAATLELPPEQASQSFVEEEIYASSLWALRQWGGHIAVAGAEVEAPTRALAENDLVAAIIENIGSSDERDRLDAERIQIYETRNGQAIAADGTPMVTLIERGIDASRKAARRDARMAGQVTRDELDLELAIAVDGLEAGEALLALSLDPKEALAAHRELYEALGYRDGEARLQVYARLNDGRILAGSIAVNYSEPEKWRGLLKDQLGIEVPESATCNEWTHYSARLNIAPEAAMQLAMQTRHRYYEAVGRARERLSVSEFVTEHMDIVQAYVDRYMAPLAEAIYTRTNNTELQGLAAAIAQTAAIEQFVKPVREAVLQTVHSAHFSPTMGRAMEEVIRYGIIEDLRHYLSPRFHQAKAATLEAAPSYAQLAYLPAEQLAARLADNVDDGIQAGHVYGGCAGIRLTEHNNQQADGERSPQDAYGGRGAAAESSGGDCDYMHDNCYCSPYNSDGTKRKSKLRVMARRTPEGAYCLRPGCGACIFNDGRSYKGRIAARAEALKQAVEKQQAA